MDICDFSKNLRQQEVPNDIGSHLNLKTVFCHTSRRIHDSGIIDKAVDLVISFKSQAMGTITWIPFAMSEVRYYCYERMAVALIVSCIYGSLSILFEFCFAKQRADRLF